MVDLVGVPGLLATGSACPYRQYGEFTRAIAETDAPAGMQMRF